METKISLQINFAIQPHLFLPLTCKTIEILTGPCWLVPEEAASHSPTLKGIFPVALRYCESKYVMFSVVSSMEPSGCSSCEFNLYTSFLQNVSFCIVRD